MLLVRIIEKSKLLVIIFIHFTDMNQRVIKIECVFQGIWFVKGYHI